MFNFKLIFIYIIYIMDKTFFNFKLDLEPNVIDMIYDILRMSTIQLVTQIMFYMNNSSLSLFSETFIKTFVFINMSILFYYLVVRKVFSFVSHDYLNVKDKTYTQTPPIKSQSSVSLKTPPPPATPSTPPPSSPSPSNTPDPNNNTQI
jgi:hypothetical protein